MSPGHELRILYVDERGAEHGADSLASASETLAVDAVSSVGAVHQRLQAANVECIVHRRRGGGWIDVDETPLLVVTDAADEAIERGATDAFRIDGAIEDWQLLGHRVERLARHDPGVFERLERYETVLEAIGDPVYAVDEDGRCTFVNDAYVEHSGRTRGDLIGTRVADLRQPSEVAKVQAVIEDLLGDDRSRGMVEIERGDPAPEPRRMESHIALLPPDEDGSYRGSAGVLRDITDRTERERLLERYRSLVDAMTDPACIYDRDGKFVLVNERLAEWYEESPEDLVGHDSAMLDGIREAGDGDVFNELVEGERDELRGEYEAGDSLDRGELVEYRLTPLVIDGESRGAVAVSRDISERKRQERKLRETRTVLENVVENLPVGVLVEDGERNVLVANGTLEDVLDANGAAASLVGGPVSTFVDQVRDRFEKSEVFAASFDDRVTEGETVRYEEWELTDGRTFERDYIPFSLLGDRAGLWIFREVTNRKDRERELQEQNARLEEFASFVSHDLRNPLNVAQGRLELASEELEENRHLEDVAQAHDRMQALIEDLLVMAREGVTDVDGSVKLADLFITSWNSVATADAEHEVRTARTIRADAGRLRQLLENLIRNAVEHAGEDVTVTIGDLQDGFFVEDDGSGIPEEESERIFEAGYTTTRDGTGLGLNIVDQVAEEHNWRVSVGEGDAGGARFDVRNVDRL